MSKRIAPCGSWASPITSDLIVAGTIGLDELSVDGDDIYWVERRPAEEGRNTIIRRRAGRNEELTPKPFNPRTTVRFALPESGPVRLLVFNQMGQRVKVLVDGERAWGRHQVVWEGADEGGRLVASGVYFARLETAGEARNLKMVLLR